MKSTQSFFLPIKVLALIALYCVISAKVKAQTPTATDPVYIQREYMKAIRDIINIKSSELWVVVDATK